MPDIRRFFSARGRPRFPALARITLPPTGIVVRGPDEAETIGAFFAGAARCAFGPDGLGAPALRTAAFLAPPEGLLNACDWHEKPAKIKLLHLHYPEGLELDKGVISSVQVDLRNGGDPATDRARLASVWSLDLPADLCKRWGPGGDGDGITGRVGGGQPEEGGRGGKGGGSDNASDDGA